MRTCLGLSVKAINPFENCELAELLKGSLVYSLFISHPARLLIYSLFNALQPGKKISVIRPVLFGAIKI